MLEEKLEYGKKELKVKEDNINEVFMTPKEEQAVEPKTKIKKAPKFKKDDAIRE